MLSRHISSSILRNSLLPRIYVQGLNKTLPTSFKTSAPMTAHVKTPVQAWGYDYLNKQKELKRPLSPHLGIYQAQLTWYLSGLHRISGIAMGAAVGIMAIGMMVAPFDFPQVIEYIRLAGLPTSLVYAIKYCIVWPMTYYALAELRFLGFDLALGIDLPSIYRSGWFIVALSVILATIFTFWRKSDKELNSSRP